jgi:hypothetical protein
MLPKERWMNATIKTHKSTMQRSNNANIRYEFRFLSLIDRDQITERLKQMEIRIRAIKTDSMETKMQQLLRGMMLMDDPSNEC